MNSYNMRAFTLGKQELFTFNVVDVPLSISDKKFVLARRPGTPILIGGSIMRGMDIPDLFEGDIVMSEGVEYLIKYTRGFYAVAENGDYKMIYELNDYKVTSNIFNTKFNKPPNLKERHLFKYRGNIIRLDDFAGIYCGKAVVKGVSLRIDPTELQQEAGFRYHNNTMFFGDLVDGYPLEMYYGRPCIKKPDGIYDILKGGKIVC